MFKRFCLVSLSIIYILLCGCSSSDKYYSFVDDYYKVFCSVAKNIDIENTYKSIELLQSEENKEYIDKMEKLLEDIKGDVPQSKKDHYSELKTLYDGLIFLKSTYDKWDELTLEEQSKINVEMMTVHRYYQGYKNNTIVH